MNQVQFIKHSNILTAPRRDPDGVVVNVQQCDIVVNELELQSRYKVHFHAKELIYTSSNGLIEPLLFCYKDNFGIK